jgi:hypothetical protein
MGGYPDFSGPTKRQKRAVSRALLPFGFVTRNVIGDLLSLFVGAVLILYAGELALTYWYISATVILLWAIHRIDNRRRATKRRRRKRTPR